MRKIIQSLSRQAIATAAASLAVSSGCISIGAQDAYASGGSVYVQMQTATIRKSPKHYAPSVTEVRFGQALTTLGDDGDWLKVKAAGGKEGFIHSSALSSKKIVIAKGGTRGKGPDEADVVLAGKGFSPEVEKSYAQKDRSLNFAAVNLMERSKVSEGELQQFLSAGKLKR